MKTNPIQNFPPSAGDDCSARPLVNPRSGVALLIVLGMLVLLSVIVLAFVSSVTTDLADSQQYAAQTNTRMLADSVLDVVEIEIRAASTGTNQAWISQPGLLRTYDTNGSAVAAYKLYSAAQMVVPGAFDPNAGTDLPSSNTWLNQPNLYTDLNSPVASGTTSSGSTNYIFPVIDGNDIKSITMSGSSQLTYTTDGTLPTIEGFATVPSKVGINYNSGNTLSATNSPVPMPVQWLYMLKDGSLIPATGVSNSKDVVFSGTLVPTGTNPIVARVAFWTDDETSKVNINTASEGTFWDTPVCVTQPNVSDVGEPDPMGNSQYVFNPNQIFEYDLALRQPDRNEYQRYPGHPATTCLSPILGDTIYKGLNLKRSPPRAWRGLRLPFAHRHRLGDILRIYQPACPPGFGHGRHGHELSPRLSERLLLKRRALTAPAAPPSIRAGQSHHHRHRHGAGKRSRRTRTGFTRMWTIIFTPARWASPIRNRHRHHAGAQWRAS